MAILKTRQIREMKPEDLNTRLKELKLELLKEMGNVKMGRAIKNPGKIKELRKAIARILTVQQGLKKT
jgi:large subunit ribosomal protein L29